MGLYTGNWLLAAAEAPSVVGLLLVAFLARTATSGSALVKAASVVGLLCIAELAVATIVFDAHGTQLAVIVILSTGLTAAAGVAYWLRISRHESR